MPAAGTDADSDFSLDQSLNFQRRSVGLCFANILSVDLENPEFDDVFNFQIRQTFVADFSDELGSHFEDLHLNEAFERFLLETHLGDLPDKSGVDLKDPRFDEFLDRKS